MKRFFLILIVLIFIANCNKVPEPIINSNAIMPNCKFMIISDIHYYSKELGNGPTLEEYLNNDRKLLLLSDKILKRTIDIVYKNKPDFIIIPGDLTKDGEYINHTILKNYFEELEDSNINVFIINGNHDIANDDANSYTDTIRKVRTVNALEFENIYKDFGFNESIYRDSFSLSYITEPVEGLWLIALDGCIYDKVRTHPKVSGRIKKETLKWLEDKLIKANRLNKYVIVFLHHNLIEHFKGQKKNYAPYVLNNNNTLKRLFRKYNVSIVFTGHFHANDIVYEKVNNKNIYDIETGSLVTYPSPIRLINANNNKLHINTITIDSIDSLGYAFKNYSRNFTYTGISNISKKILTSFKVNEKDAIKIANKIADIFIKHYSGTENTNNTKLLFDNISLFSRFIVFTQKGRIEGIMNDSTPHDNDYIIDLSDN